MPPLDWLIRPIAHRGLHRAQDGIIENTASAFEAAIDANYAIETDVRTSADGQAMVFHDASLERLTTGAGAVAALAAEDLKKTPFRATGDRMQTLPDLLDQVAGQVPLVIEVKGDWNDQGPLERRIAADLADYEGHVAVMSFDPHSVKAFARAAPDIPRGLVADRCDDPHDWPTLTWWQCVAMRHLLSSLIARPHFIAYDIGALPALAPLTARYVFRRPLLTWTVRTKAERRRAERWADAMIFEGFGPEVENSPIAGQG